jgi:hypothetical protein
MCKIGPISGVSHTYDEFIDTETMIANALTFDLFCPNAFIALQLECPRPSARRAIAELSAICGLFSTRSAGMAPSLIARCCALIADFVLGEEVTWTHEMILLANAAHKLLIAYPANMTTVFERTCTRLQIEVPGTIDELVQRLSLVFPASE